MGHYDRDYEDTERSISDERIAREMKAKRKLIAKLEELTSQIDRTINHACDVPDRFKWALEDFHNWLSVGLDEWERDHLLEILKK
jgi:hypothetical protein